MPQEIPVTCSGCGERFSIEHAISCPRAGLVLAQHDDTEKKWGALGAWSLVASAIIYKQKINSRTVQDETTGSRARQESGTADGGADIVIEAQGGSGHTVNGSARLAGRSG